MIEIVLASISANEGQMRSRVNFADAENLFANHVQNFIFSSLMRSIALQQ